MLNDKDIKKLSEVFATKEDVVEFKNEILNGQDEIMEKLDILIQEKTIGDEQDKRQKKVLEIHNNALRKTKVLSEKEASEIDKLRVF